MREDMAKVITERPRSGGGIKAPKGENRRWNKIPDDEKPYKERGGVRFKWKARWQDEKEFGEHLGPLKRFALSCVGRKWDDVYSEVCKYIDKGNVVQNHILTHLYQFIERNVTMIDGKPYHSDYPFTPIAGSYYVTYVNPDTGIIECSPSRKKYRRKQRRRVDVIKITEDRFYMKDSNGIWYECWTKPTPPPYIPWSYTSQDKIKVQPIIYDCFLRAKLRANDYHLAETYGRKGIYCYKKLQLNKREIRRLTKPKN